MVGRQEDPSLHPHRLDDVEAEREPRRYIVLIAVAGIFVVALIMIGVAFLA